MSDRPSPNAQQVANEHAWRVVCYDCPQSNGEPAIFYESTHEWAARRYFQSASKRAEHDVRLERTVLLWEQVRG